MNFQEQMQKNLRTPQEVQSEEDQKAIAFYTSLAQSDFDSIQQKLLKAAKDGQYQTKNEKKIISCTHVIGNVPAEYGLVFRDTQWFQYGIKEWTDPAVLNLNDRMHKLPYSQWKYFLKQHKGEDLYAGGKPAMYRSIISFREDHSLGYKEYFDKIRQLCRAESIELVLCVQNRIGRTVLNNELHELPCTLHDIPKGTLRDWIPVWKATYAM